MGMVAPENALERVQRTCQEGATAAAAAGHVQLAAAAAAAAALPPLADISAACQFLRLPIRFDSQAAEVNAMALLHLLDFGSGFDPLLLPKTGRDAHEAVQFGLLGMLMHGAPLESRAWLAAFGGDQAFQFFGIDATEDEPVPGLPGVVMTRQGPLGAFTAQLREAMAQTGAALAAAGQPSLGALVLATLDAQAAAGQAPSAAGLVEALAEAVPAFHDVADYRGRQVCFYRKAQALAVQLHLRFRGADPRFRFADAHSLTADSGNVLPAVFRRMGVLALSEDLAAAVDSGTDLQGDEREVALRAATVVAAAAVCAAVNAAASGEGDGGGDGAAAALQPWQLSLYLLHQEEQAERRRQEAGGAAAPAAGPPRHVARGTLAY